MCNNLCGGNNFFWIIILVLLFCCGGCNQGTCNDRCGCDRC